MHNMHNLFLCTPSRINCIVHRCGLSVISLVMARYSHKGHDTIRYDPKVLHCM